ncbi:P-loop containing nucleoside triphosphate hydrolase protein [Aspergillus multicolor]|uniref:ATP-binding protein n=1 Tax=Aspergillus multicolor TaxID=41759 RepID=UPI003CCD7BCF
MSRQYTKRPHPNPATAPALYADDRAIAPNRDPVNAHLHEPHDGTEESGSDNESSLAGIETARLSLRQGNRPQRADHRKSLGQRPGSYIVIYHVHCTRQGAHRKHEKITAYLDPPRLFKGDSRLSALRGKKIIEDLPKFLDQHGDLNFIVSKRFECHAYHKEMDALFEPLPMPQDPEIPESIQPYFFSLRRHGDWTVPYIETIEILSDTLKDAVVTATGMTHDHASNLGSSRNMNMLQHLLYQFDRWKEERAISLLIDQRRLLDDLLGYMKWSNGPDYEEADELISQGLINQEHLAKLCGAGEIMVHDVDTHPRAYMMLRPPKSGIAPLTLSLWSWEFEDGVFRQGEFEMRLDWPASAAADSAVPITSLEIYPLRYAASGVEKRLKARGELFWRCRKQCFVAYNPPDGILGIQMTTPRYMVDMKTYGTMHADPDSIPTGKELDSDAMDKNDPPSGSFLLLLPHAIRGFAFHDKKWRSLFVERILEINWNNEAFDRLVMQHHKKELIKALVTVHSTSAVSTDIIEGKGNGLIILLHGGPGTGKTLTAESVAELTRKPLYRVTCRDIGTNAEEVEKYLESVLLLGTIWGCVVLLDEADVFLEERRETDLQRNALVSVFLRVLEYYHGILILTSNRIGTFDSAFKSRFQLTIHYPDLDVEGRYEIWRNFISGLSKNRPDVDIDGLKARLKDLAQVNLNGRQIRNTVQTALQLADFRKEILDYGHLERVIKVVEEFEAQLDTRGYTDLDWVHHQGIRPS